MNETIAHIDTWLAKVNDSERRMSELSKTLTAQQDKLNAIVFEQKMTSQSLQALQDVRPILAAVSSEQAISLANQALRYIFLTEDTLFFSEEDSRFFISTPEGDTDLLAGNGGGYQAVISFIFTLFLLTTSESRRLLFYDEQFTQLSDECLERFIDFLRNLCKDLSLDVCLITHDSRIVPEAVDHIYFIEDGHAKKVK